MPGRRGRRGGSRRPDGGRRRTRLSTDSQAPESEERVGRAGGWCHRLDSVSGEDKLNAPSLYEEEGSMETSQTFLCKNKTLLLIPSLQKRIQV